MSLYKYIPLNINYNKVSLTRNIKFYVNDCLDLIFNIKTWDIKNKRPTDRESPTLTLEDITAKLLVKSPNGDDTIEATEIIDDNIIFRFEKKFTKFPGTGKLQLMLIDSDGCEVKTPEFSFEIKRTINKELDDTSVVSKAYTTEDNKIILTEDGKILIN